MTPPGNAIDELAQLVVDGWVATTPYEALQEGLLDVLGVSPVARLALDRALRRRVPGSAGLGGCWASPSGASGSGEDADPLEAFLRRVLRSGRTGAGDAPEGGRRA